MFATERRTYSLWYLISQLHIYGFDNLFQSLSGYLFRWREGVFFIVIAIIRTTKDIRWGLSGRYRRTVPFCFSLMIQKHWYFFLCVEKFLSTHLFGVKVKALSESMTHVEVGQEDSFMCTHVHDCENLFCHLPCSYPPGNLSINKSQTEQRNILLPFNSPLFKKMLLYTPYSMLSHDCGRLFSIKYSQANNKSQYITS